MQRRSPGPARRGGAARAAAGFRRDRCAAYPPRRPAAMRPPPPAPSPPRLSVRAAASWLSLARHIGPERIDLVIAQKVAPRRHLVVLAELDRADEARLVVGNLA